MLRDLDVQYAVCWGWRLVPGTPLLPPAANAGEDAVLAISAGVVAVELINGTKAKTSPTPVSPLQVGDVGSCGRS